MSKNQRVDGQVTGLAAEKIAREKLEKRLGVKFFRGRKEKTLIVGVRTNRKPIPHEFDLVSEDQRIVGEVKSAKHTEKHHLNTRLPRVLGDCRYLEKVKAERKLLVFTDKNTFDVMKRDLDGLISQDIEILHVKVDT